MAPPRRVPRTAGLHAAWRTLPRAYAGPSARRRPFFAPARRPLPVFFVPRPPAWLVAHTHSASAPADGAVRTPSWTMPPSARRAMQHSWAHVSADPPATAAAAALAAAVRDAPPDAARVLGMLRDVLEHDVHPDTALVKIQAALALAYTSFLRPPAPAAPALAPALLGLAAEALVGAATDDAYELARKLLTYAQLHVGAVDLAHFRRITQHLGRRGELERVLQLTHLAAQHHPGAPDAGLTHARLLAYDGLGLDAEYRAAWHAAAPATAPTLELHAWHAASRHDAPQLAAALHALAGLGALPVSTYLVLAYAHAPLRPLLARLPRAAHASPAVLCAALVQLAHDAGGTHIPTVLALFGVPRGSAALADADVRVPREVRAALAAAGAAPVRAPTLALAATWCARHARPELALDLFDAALHAAPDARPRAVVEEHQTPAHRSADHAALQHAAAGVVRACTAAGAPRAAAAFAAHVVGTPHDAEHALCAREAALVARIAHLPRGVVERGSAGTAALLACAGALEDAAYARAVLCDAAAHGLKPNGRVRRALARLLLHSAAGHYAEMQRLQHALVQHAPWAGGAAPEGADPAAARLAKLRAALSSLGFEEHAQLARLQGVRQQSAAGARAVHAETREASYEWVRDTPLQPAAHEPWSTVPPVRAAERTPLAHAARLRLCAAQGDADGAQAAFRALLDADVRPSAMHLVPLVQSLCRAQRTAEAQWLLRVALPAWDVAPTHAMYAALLQALAHAGDWRGVQRELAEMGRAGLAPDAALGDALALARQRQPAGGAREGGVPACAGAPSAAPAPSAPATEATAAALAPHAAAVTQHFQRRMHARDYLGAQRFYAACLRHGLRPHYSHRRMLKRAGNYVQKLLRRAPHAAELHEALRLQQANARASAFATHPAGRAHVAAQRRYRRALLELVRDVISGRLEQAARLYTPTPTRSAACACAEGYDARAPT